MELISDLRDNYDSRAISRLSQDRSRGKQARRAGLAACSEGPALMSNFTKAGSEDWQSTLTRAPLFANLFFDRLAALGSRAVNAPFRGLCLVALFDQVVDCRLLAYVPPVDTPWRCGGHSHSPNPLWHSLHFCLGQVRRRHWNGRPFHRGYRQRLRRLLNRLRPLRFLSYRRVA